MRHSKYTDWPRHTSYWLGRDKWCNRQYWDGRDCVLSLLAAMRTAPLAAGKTNAELAEHVYSVYTRRGGWNEYFLAGMKSVVETYQKFGK